MEESQVSDLGNGSVDTNVSAPAAEKVFTRDQVAKIVNAEKSKAVDAARREAEQKYQRDIEQLNASRSQQPSGNTNSQNPVDTNAIYQQITERFNKDRQEELKRQEEQRYKEQIQGIANRYISKMSNGKAAYEDFDEVTQDFDPAAFPQLTYLLSDMDNAHEILYDLAKNPLKIAGLDRLAERNPKQAIAEMHKLGQSIMQNKQAKADAKDQYTAPPLDRLQSSQDSRVSGSNGKQSVNSLRYESWLKG